MIFHIDSNTVEKHSSQKDYATGFGGKFGVQSDRIDISAVGWDHIDKVEKHESQKDYSKGLGGKFGVQEDRKDKSAAGWDRVRRRERVDIGSLCNAVVCSLDVRFCWSLRIANCLLHVSVSSMHIASLKEKRETSE